MDGPAPARLASALGSLGRVRTERERSGNAPRRWPHVGGRQPAGCAWLLPVAAGHAGQQAPEMGKTPRNRGELSLTGATDAFGGRGANG